MDEYIDLLGDKNNDDDTEEEATLQFLGTLQNTVKKNHDKIFATWYNNKGMPTDEYTYQQIWDEAGVIAHNLRLINKLEKGDRVILCYSFGLHFFSAFLGCLRSGIIAIPVYPPSPQNLRKALTKLEKIIQDSHAKLILLDNAVNLIRLNPLSKSRNYWPQNIIYQVHPKNVKMSPLNDQSFQIWDEIVHENLLTQNDLAFLQYTSGSTGDPKGVMVTYKALNANLQAIVKAVYDAFESSGVSTKNIVGLSWLPQYHDMGLLGAFIVPFASGWKSNIMSPLDFIKDPLLWINLMSRLQVNWSAGPNFAYRLVARKFIEAKTLLSSSVGQKEPIPNLNLSSIVYLQLGAEPIQSDTREVFQQAFGSYGLHDNWFAVGYGLAESVVYVTHLHEFKISTFEPTKGQPSVAVGNRKFFFKGHTAKVVCPTTFEELGDQQVGELWLSGPSITAGYFGKPQLTMEVFQARLKQDSNEVYFRTGDLAFFENDYLYICGRNKDLIIVNGVNYYPQDVEYAAQNASNAVRPGCVAAFSSNDTGGDGNLEVVFEVRREYAFDAADIANMVRQNIIDEIGLVPTRLVAIEERTILKTTSGKIRRKDNRKALHDDAHKIIYEYNSTQNSDAADGNLLSQKQKEQLEKYDPFDKIMISFFGMDYDGNDSWDELGLSSMASLSLRDKISDSFAVTLDPECFKMHPTPDALKAFVLSNQGGTLEVCLPLLRALKYNYLSWSFLGFLQVCCSILLLMLFVISILSPWLVQNFVLKNWILCVDRMKNGIISYVREQPFGWMPPPFVLRMKTFFVNVHAFGTKHDTRWLWIPLAVPVCMLSFSFCVIFLKWVVIGKYKEGVMPIPSLLYLRWWFVDRSVALWESWVGRHIVNTPLINFFYFLMGAKVHRTVSIEAFIREFDLVEIQQGSSLEFQIHCRKFDKWRKDENPSLRFRHITIGQNCTVKGMVSVGASVGDNSIVDKLSVVQQGAKVPNGTHVFGNPAYIIKRGLAIKTPLNSYFFLGLLKFSWMVLELYIFFGTTLLGRVLWVSYLPQHWRYTNLLKVFLLILWFNFCSIFTSIMLKWLLIGKRRPGPAHNDTLWRKFADWAADWHFEVGVGLLLSMTSNTRLWNVVLKLHGLEIDMMSRAGTPGIFLPSKVDLIKVKNSFLSSIVKFSPKGSGHYHEIKINDSSIGYLVHIEPKKTNLVSISGSVVPPMTHVTSSIIPEQPDPRTLKFTTLDIVRQESLLLLGYTVSFGILFCTLIPSYEFCTYILYKISSVWITVSVLACAFVLQTLSWTLLLICVQYVTMINAKETGRPFSSIFHSLYMNYAYFYQSYSFVYTLLGSSTFNAIMKLLGVQFEGKQQALLFPQRMYEFSYLTFADRTIVDGSHVTGHHIVYDNFAVGPCKVAGVVHEGCYVANTVITSEESESLRTFIGAPPDSATTNSCNLVL